MGKIALNVVKCASERVKNWVCNVRFVVLLSLCAVKSRTKMKLLCNFYDLGVNLMKI
jgi:hypothetical protein